MEADTHSVEAICAGMLEAHFSNKGLQYLVSTAAAALGNPIVVVDASYRYTAHHLGSLESDDSALAQAMSAEIQNEVLHEPGLAYIRDHGIDSKIARSQGPFEQFNEILQCNTMTLAVMVHSVCVAHVMMLEHDHPFDDIDRACFVQLSKFVGQELQKSEVWGPTTGEMGSYFLENLLSDRSPSAAVTERRIQAINFHPKEVFYVVCLHAPGEGLSQLQAERLASQLRPLLHHALYTRHHQQLVLLISRDKEVGFSEHAERRLREVVALNKVTAGVSNVFSSIIETRTAYEQARAAVRYGERGMSARDDDGLFRFCDYAHLYLFALAGRRTNLVSLCHPGLLALVEHDRKHAGELTETLWCYLLLGCSTARAAQMLCLHKNTLLYRLGKIRDITGMDLSCGNCRFQLQLGLRMLMSLGLFSPRTRPLQE